MKTVEIAYRYDGAEASLRERPVDADAARLRLNDGNRAFAELFTRLEEGTGTVASNRPDRSARSGPAADRRRSLQQRPFAAVLGCADARVPIELIFNEGPNDLFVVRVAGNTLGEDVRGSLNYAIDHLGDSLKLIVVLGHSACGAVTAAVDVFLDPPATSRSPRSTRFARWSTACWSSSRHRPGGWLRRSAPTSCAIATTAKP